MNRSLLLLGVAIVAAVIVSLVALTGGRDEGDNEAAAVEITEDALPAGFSETPEVTVNGQRHRFDKVPGHYWKVIDDRGFAIGLHFQTDEPFKWARDVAKGELLYMVYAVPGNCGDGSFSEAVRSEDASVLGKLPPGFDHWHAVPGGKSRVGHWLMHVPVRDFALAGPPGNPATGAKITAGTPEFIPVCDIR